MSTAAFPPGLLSRVEDAGLNASAPPQQRWLDGWLVRFSPGKAQRARCINAVADGVLSLEERLAASATVFREAGLRQLFRITPFTRPPGLDGWLAERGFERFDETCVMVRADLQPLPPEPWPAHVRIEDADSEAFAHIIGTLRGTDLVGQQAHRQRLLNSPVAYRAAVLRRSNGDILACGQVAQEGSLVGLYDVHTVASERGRGLSRALCSALLNRAFEAGARSAYLQVDAQNHPARAVYRRLGFVDAYPYHYRGAPT